MPGLKTSNYGITKNEDSGLYSEALDLRNSIKIFKELGKIEAAEKAKEQLKEIESHIYTELSYPFEPIYSNNKRANKCMGAINIDVDLGLPFFKFYNSNSFETATKMWRLFITIPYLYPKNRYNGKIAAETSISSKEIQLLNRFLNDRNSTFPRYKNFEVIKYFWNKNAGYYLENINEYLNGKYDNEYRGRDYVPSDAICPIFNKELYYFVGDE